MVSTARDIMTQNAECVGELELPSTRPARCGTWTSGPCRSAVTMTGSRASSPTGTSLFAASPTAATPPPPPPGHWPTANPSPSAPMTPSRTFWKPCLSNQVRRLPVTDGAWSASSRRPTSPGTPPIRASPTPCKPSPSNRPVPGRLPAGRGHGLRRCTPHRSCLSRGSLSLRLRIVGNAKAQPLRKTKSFDESEVAPTRPECRQSGG